MAATVGIVIRCSLIEAHHRNQRNKSKVALCNLSICFNSHLKPMYISNKMKDFSYKGGCGIHGLETFKRKAGLGYR